MQFKYTLYTSLYNEDVTEEFFGQASTKIENCYTGNITIVLADFNAKVGQRQTGETNIGNFGLGARNQRWQMTIEFTLRNRLKIMNTFFQKPLKRKWTWKAPNGTVKNEIDYRRATRPDIVKDVNVITKANVGSNHRLVVSKIKIDTYFQRRRMVKRNNYIDKDTLHHLSENFEQHLSNRFYLLTLENDIDNHTSNIVDI